ncbi:MAG TPA: 30S ribosomal protein S9 [Myxococcota bacterium]|nr:30S ribosomal protein S9 [Myxococcota bacterium]HOD00568.1 30S ribosomal protein S9 [Myxococcota bacterium]HOH75921.1 30S ribosomal protein S9 [Myxococcota bacterium]HPV03181.1 30S ribosomal protein S9 [Myxococcota bacterium]
MAEANVMWATGRRKEAAARVRVLPGTGKITVNGRDLDNYFCRPNHRILVRTPFVVLGNGDQFDVLCTVRGGGETGQAGAIRHGIARALAAMNVEEWRGPVKRAGFLTRDPRAKERKKYGRPGARKRFQYSKR